MSVTAAEMAQLTGQIKILAQTMAKFTQSQSHLTRDTNIYSSAVRDATNELEDMEEAHKKETNQSKTMLRLQRELRQAKQDEINTLRQLKREQSAMVDLRRSRANSSISQADFETERTRLRNNANSSRSQLANIRSELARTEGALGSLSGGVLSVASKLNIVTGILGMVGGAILNFNKTFMEATTSSAGVIEETTGNFDQGMGHWLTTLSKTGVASKDMIKYMAVNRQMVNSLGGMDNAISTATDSVIKTRGMYGTLEETWQANLQVMTNFANLGIKPTQDAMNSYTTDLDTLARMTGMSGEAMNAMIQDIAGDSDSLQLLQSVRADEREAILANQRALLQSNIALGMTATQAAAAAKMLNKMVNEKPLDRLKRAAKLRAIGAALGLGSQTEAAAREYAKPKGQANEAIISEATTAVANTLGAASQKGFASELQASILSEKLGFDEINSTFNTQLGDTNKSLIDIKEGYKSASDSTIVLINTQIDIAKSMLGSLLSGEMILAFMLDSTRGLNNLAQSGLDLASIANDETGYWFSQLIGTISTGLGNILNIFGHNVVGDFFASAGADFFDKGEDFFAHYNETKEKPIKTMSEELQSQAATKLEEKATKISTKEQANLAAISPGATNVLSNTPTSPSTPVKVEPTIAQASAEKTTTDRSYATAQYHTNLLTDQNTKIDQQLANMKDANLYLKTMAEVVPKLLDTAEKQLAVSTMSQEQKDKAAKSLGSWNAKFSADYNYGAA